MKENRTQTLTFTSDLAQKPSIKLKISQNKWVKNPVAHPYKKLNCRKFKKIVKTNLSKKVYPKNLKIHLQDDLHSPLISMIFRSIIEPVRNVGFRDPHDLHLADAISCDFEKKTVKCQSVLDEKIVWEVPYDKLVIGVGALPNTFGVPGVEQYAYFLKV